MLESGGIFYSVVERGVITMGDFDNPNIATVQSNRPKELVYKFEVPLVVKASMLELDVAENTLKLKYKDAYNLNINLPYPVDDKKGSAKYDKGPKRLTVTLPVKVNMNLPKQASVGKKEEEKVVQVRAGGGQEGEGGIDDSQGYNNDDDCEDDTGGAAMNTEPTAKSKAKLEQDKAKGHDKWVDRDALVEKELEAKKLKEEIQAKMEEATALASKAKAASDNIDVLKKDLSSSESKLDEARRNVDESCANLDKKHVSFASTSSDDNDIIKDENEVMFIEAPSFRGSRRGYVFKKGEKGLGRKTFNCVCVRVIYVSITYIHTYIHTHIHTYTHA